MRLFALLLTVMFFAAGCATFRGMRDGFKEDTHHVFSKAHKDIMKLDAKIKEKAW